MALGWFYRDLTTPGNPIISLTEAQWRAMAARYVPDVDNMEYTRVVADTNWLTFPDRDMWLSLTGTFNPTTVRQPTQANAIPTHRQNDKNVPGSRNT